ncbi:MAG TPA: endolytic transglycosylase MltG [Solirubrobacterales bacterium]
MNDDRGGVPPDEPWADDPFTAEDPAARERARRRAEREQRRAKRRGKSADGEPPAPSGPSASDRAAAALSGLGERISRRRAERQEPAKPPPAELPPPQAPLGHASPLEGEPAPFDFGEPEQPPPPAEPPTATAEPEPPTATAEPATEVAPPRRVSEPERYSHSTPPPSGGGLRGRLPRPRPVWIIVAVFVIAVLLFANALFQPFHGGGEGKVVFTVKKGEAAGAVADRLDEEGIISSGTLFDIRLTLAGHRGDVFAGRYVLADGMSYSEAIDELTKPPSQRALPVTVPEGYSREQIAKLSTQAGLKGSYEAASKGSKQLDPAKYGAEGAASLEGFLFPSTYELKPKSTADDLVSAQLTAFEKQFARVDMSYAKSKNLTPYDVLTIASMIDREVQLDEERDLVASVIYNRLDQGEPLGVDATIRYEDGNFTEPIAASRLEQNTPYNTYTNQGLPPTPIGNPGLAAIEAAANPAKTDYLFYVVKPGTCGEHVFTETLEEHTAAQAKYDEAREAAGGKSPDTC